MDHSGIRIRIGFEGIVPRLPIYDKIVFRRCRKLSDVEIDNLLNNEFNKWYDKYSLILNSKIVANLLLMKLLVSLKI